MIPFLTGLNLKFSRNRFLLEETESCSDVVEWRYGAVV